MAVITPYAQFLFRFISDAPEYVFSLSLSLSAHYVSLSPFLFWLWWRKNITIKFARRTDVMPPVPVETKHHPSAVDLLLIKRLISDTSKKTLLQFLQHEFVNINKSFAARLVGKKAYLICYKHLKLALPSCSDSLLSFPPKMLLALCLLD